jgi:predicted RNA-binding Zn-ribbon protein involved in translation (DUF1610 family)
LRDLWLSHYWELKERGLQKGGRIMKVICNSCKKEKTIDIAGTENDNFSIPRCGGCGIKINHVFITPFEYIGKRVIATHLFDCPACGYGQIINDFKFCPNCGEKLTFNLHILGKEVESW